MRFRKLNLIEQRSFKERGKLRSKIGDLKYGNLGIMVYKSCRFEYVYINLVRRYFKTYLKLKYTNIKLIKIWVFLKANFPISKKSKNARMGKGTGSFIRWAIKLSRGFIVVEFFNLNKIRVTKLYKSWQKNLGIPLVLVENQNI